jgi:hypothetical protein
VAALAGLLGVAVLVVLNAAIAAVCVRLLRVRLSTRLGVAVFAGILVPVPLVVVVLVGSGILGLGADLGSRSMAVWTTILLPLGLGAAFDVFWMPSPSEVEIRQGREVD